MAGDKHWANVQLLLHMDGDNDSTTFTDSSATPKTITRNGALIKTAQSKFGGASGYFDGVDDYLSASHASLDLGAGDWTVEGWLYVTSFAAVLGFWFNGTFGSNTGRHQIDIKTDGEVTLFGASSSTSYSVGAAAAVSLNTWHHIAATRSGNTVYLFVDGVLVGSSAVANEPAAGLVQYVGYARNGGLNRFLNGYIDDFRLTPGIARYTASFTPPVAPYPDRLPWLQGAVRDHNNNLVARTVRAYRRDTGALIGEMVSDAGTGAFSIDTAHDGEHTVIALDDEAGDVHNALIFDRVIPV